MSSRKNVKSEKPRGNILGRTLIGPYKPENLIIAPRKNHTVFTKQMLNEMKKISNNIERREKEI